MPKRKLDWDTVRLVRTLAHDFTIPYNEISRRTGIKTSSVHAVVYGHIWKDRSYVPPPPRPVKRLTWPEVREIRALYAEGATGHAIAFLYQVSHVTVHHIVTCKTWRVDPDGTAYQPMRRGRGNRAVEPVIVWRNGRNELRYISTSNSRRRACSSVNPTVPQLGALKIAVATFS